MPKKFRICWEETYCFDRVMEAENLKEAIIKVEDLIFSGKFDYNENPKSGDVEGEYIDDSYHVNYDCSGELNENGDLIENL